MKIITLANQKGGCGKSTIVLNLAIEFALQQYRVIIFDTDPQGSCYETAEIRDDQGETAQIKVAAIYENLYQAIEECEKNYDFAIIDTPPHDNEVVTVATVCSDLIIIPVQDSPLDIRSTKTTVNLINEARKLNPNIEPYFLLSRIQTNSVMARELAQVLKSTYKFDILKTKIANRMAYKYSLIYGQNVSEFSGKDSAAEEIRSLAKEVLSILDR
ncbi:ParA family partition ATPase [Desulfobacter vibrioformis]|uniref:ParA family partition ATPase n=1 Tax=Desulfobacter vibrioformis TaxID=34031 RepID=UPI0005552297|nr:ParA family partition ATPase [Desulfobacter vibrioformis]